MVPKKQDMPNSAKKICYQLMDKFYMKRYLLLLMVLFLITGCASYHMGNQSLFSPGVETVGISIAGNDTFRRNLGERLTEALVREIENRTPYKVVPESRADTILNVRVVADEKSVTFLNDYADPREMVIGMSVQAQWIDRRTHSLRQSQNIDTHALTISTNTPFIAESGQSVATQQQRVLENLAERIVGMMEIAW